MEESPNPNPAHEHFSMKFQLIMTVGIHLLGYKHSFKSFNITSMGLHHVVDYIGNELSWTHVDRIPWFYNSFPIRFDVTCAPCRLNGVLTYRSRNTNRECCKFKCQTCIERTMNQQLLVTEIQKSYTNTWRLQIHFKDSITEFK